MASAISLRAYSRFIRHGVSVSLWEFIWGLILGVIH